MSDLIRREDVISLVSERKCGYSLFDKTEAEIYHELAEVIQEVWKLPNAETTGALDDAIQEYIKDGYILAEPTEYVKDGTLTVQMPTIKEAKAIDKIVVYADTYKQEYSLPKVGKWISVPSFEAFGGDEICWEIRGNPTAFHYCSACKEQAYVDEFGNEILSKYCPECGAKMERSE